MRLTKLFVLISIVTILLFIGSCCEGSCAEGDKCCGDGCQNGTCYNPNDKECCLGAEGAKLCEIATSHCCNGTCLNNSVACCDFDTDRSCFPVGPGISKPWCCRQPDTCGKTQDECVEFCESHGKTRCTGKPDWCCSKALSCGSSQFACTGDCSKDPELPVKCSNANESWCCPAGRVCDDVPGDCTNYACPVDKPKVCNKGEANWCCAVSSNCGQEIGQCLVTL